MSYHWTKKRMYRNYGLKGVYKGYTITLMRCSISWGAWFGWYESLKQLLLSYNPNPSIIWFMILGAISGEWYWLSSYPVDVWKTKIQSDSFETPKYKGIIDVFFEDIQSWRNQRVLERNSAMNDEDSDYFGMNFCNVRNLKETNGIIKVKEQSSPIFSFSIILIYIEEELKDYFISYVLLKIICVYFDTLK